MKYYLLAAFAFILLFFVTSLIFIFNKYFKEWDEIRERKRLEKLNAIKN